MRIFCVSIPTTDAKEPPSLKLERPRPHSPKRRQQTKPRRLRTKDPDRPIHLTEGEPPESEDPGGGAHILLRDRSDNPGADGAAAFANREAQALIHGDRND